VDLGGGLIGVRYPGVLRGAGAAQLTVPSLHIKGAFGVGFADRSLALATLDMEPLTAPWRGETAGGAGKDAPPALRAAPGGKGEGA
jgi:hypothetical protein